jgi:hypothetical protein
MEYGYYCSNHNKFILEDEYCEECIKTKENIRIERELNYVKNLESLLNEILVLLEYDSSYHNLVIKWKNKWEYKFKGEK